MFEVWHKRYIRPIDPTGSCLVLFKEEIIHNKARFFKKSRILSSARMISFENPQTLRITISLLYL